MKPIFLVGYMGSGKSTLGFAVARKLKKQYIDLDIYIENRYRMSIKDLFNARGEAAFREIERNVLHEVGEFEDAVISCGGGTPLYGDNMNYMKMRGITVWLNASQKVLFERLSIPTAKAKRPLLAGLADDELKEYIAAAMVKRIPIYSQSEIEFNADKLDNRSQIAEATDALEKLLLEKTEL